MEPSPSSLVWHCGEPVRVRLPERLAEAGPDPDTDPDKADPDKDDPDKADPAWDRVDSGRDRDWP